MSKFSVKGLLMSAIIFLSTALASGFPATKIQWAFLGLTLMGTMIGYLTQSALFPSTSVLGDLNLKDVLKTLLIAVSNVLSSLGAAAVTSTHVDWGEIGKSILTLTIGYIAKQLVTPAPKST
jgi:hypothetical protein